MFWFNLTYHLGADVVWRCWPSLILEQNDFSNSESLCGFDASHQVSAQSNLRFGRRCCLKNLKMAPWCPSWISEWNDFSNSESPFVPQCLPSSFGFIWLTIWGQMFFEDFQDGCHSGHLWYPNSTILAVLSLHVALTPPTKFQLKLTYGLRGDVVWRISRWPPWLLSWTSERNNFSNSESPCCSNASHLVLAQFNSIPEQMLFKDFQNGLHENNNRCTDGQMDWQMADGQTTGHGINWPEAKLQVSK